MMIDLLIYLIVLALLCGLALYVVRALVTDPLLNKVFTIIIVVIVVIALIYVLLGLVGGGGAGFDLRLRR